MKKISLSVIAFCITLISFSQSTWQLDKSHARLGFTITHLMISEVDGSFKNFTASIKSTKPDFTDAKVEMSADVASINTDNEGRDKHLMSPDYFDAAKYPKLTFVSKTFTKTGNNTYVVTGDLTLHGVTKLVTLNVVARTGVNPMSKKNAAGFKITGTIKRTDFEIAPKTPSAILGDEVEIIANAEFSEG
jgi:polyisoprenoid-binding protein YceI